jgi:hypothetical protein
MSLLNSVRDGIPATSPVDDHSSSKAGWQFNLSFWHPFGRHGRECPKDIIHRKRGETERNGWTLWSFQYRRPQTLDDWYRELSSADPTGPVFVFCSRGTSAVDPDRPGAQVKTSDCRHYRMIGDREFHKVPGSIRVPHPFGLDKQEASAFVVRRVYHPIDLFERPFVLWLSQDRWRKDAIPTRGEYLIRRGGKVAMRDVSAVLELRPPYLATVTL